MPPLRERREDILPLARRFLAFFARARRSGTLPELSPAAEEALLSYAWPGNVRELRNAIERAVILWPAQVHRAAGLPGAHRRRRRPRRRTSVGHVHAGRDRARAHPARAGRAAATLDEAADILGIDASTLWRKRKKYEEPT